MDDITLISQLIIAFGIFHVWVIGFDRSTADRPGSVLAEPAGSWFPRLTRTPVSI